MSNYNEEQQKAWQKVEEAQAAAAEELECLKIKQLFYPAVQMNEADRSVIKDYFKPQPVTVEAFVQAWYMENGTLQKQLCPPKSVREANQELRQLPYDKLREQARQEQVAKEANRKNPVVQQIEPGVPILPAHWTRKYIKAASSEDIRSARIRFDRETGKPGSFNDALTARLNNSDANEHRRLYGRIGE
jgi:hypothetical protein